MKGWDFQYIQQTSEAVFMAVFFFVVTKTKIINMLYITMLIQNDRLLGNHKILLIRVKILMIYSEI